MAKTIEYTIELIHADETPDLGTGFTGYSFQPFDKRRVKHTILADNLKSLETEIRRLATDFGHSCVVWCSVPRGARKPAGFDAWKRQVNFIKHEAAAA